MIQLKEVSDGLIFIPNSKLSVFALWYMSFFVGDFEVCSNPDAYPANRRLKISGKSWKKG